MGPRIQRNAKVGRACWVHATPQDGTGKGEMGLLSGGAVRMLLVGAIAVWDRPIPETQK